MRSAFPAASLSNQPVEPAPAHAKAERRKKSARPRAAMAEFDGSTTKRVVDSQCDGSDKITSTATGTLESVDDNAAAHAQVANV